MFQVMESNTKQLISLLTLGLYALSFGYHISELNSPKNAITTCPEHPGSCIPMTDESFSFITTALNIGGFCSALLTSTLQSLLGRRWLAFSVAVFFFVGSLMTGYAASVERMVIGRLVSGFAAGTVGVFLPLWLMDLAPEGSRGAYGNITQLGIVGGILLSQVLGTLWSADYVWRRILLFPAWMAVFMMAGVFTVPTAERNEGDYQQIQEEQQTSGVWQTLRGMSSFNQRGFLLAVLFQMGQQLSGINAVMFFSTPILSSVFPTAAALVTVMVTLVNMVVTLTSTRFLDTIGFRRILVASSLCCTVFLLLLGFSLAVQFATLSALSITLFVASFAFGLGPVPFLIVPDLVKGRDEIALVQSIALASNWFLNILIGGFFLPVRAWCGEWIWVVFAADTVGVAWLAARHLHDQPTPADDEEEEAALTHQDDL
jgi:MFS family permease